MNQNEVSENNMYEATQCIVKKFDELDFKYEYEKYDDTDMLTLRFNTDTIPLVEIILVITEDFDCGIYSPNIANVNEEKMTEMLKALNELNAEYKYVRFYANNNTITVKTDNLVFPDSSDIIDEYADYIVSMIDMHIGVVEEVYPKIMETIWKTN
ncbi:MAG: hypothetical protein EGR16_08375 [Clostridiales bacterium]|nr:hypothetical protein [Clostridiales bacterium]